MGGRARRRRTKERTYWALREAEALRMQHGSKAESVCDDVLRNPQLPHRRRRLMTVVKKQTAKV